MGYLSIADTPVAVIDFETTGRVPGVDRIVELAVVSLDPGREPEVVLETLVNPQRPVAATAIHGITDEDVADAPTLDEVAGEVSRVLSGRLVAAYNVSFDIRFLTRALCEAGNP
jgi:DNA polymerase III subunit epsilon